MKKEERYTLTFKGLLSTTIDDREVLQNTLNNIELYLRRHHSTGGVPAIVFDDDKFDFVTLKKQ